MAVAVEANVLYFLCFFEFVNHVIHFEFVDVYDDEGITHLCATLSGFW
jgi:hypothetical protein